MRPPEIDIRGPVLRAEEAALDQGLGPGGVVERQVGDLYRFSVPALVHYEDRMSMACSREIRLPFLDYRLVSMIVPMAAKWKLRDGWTKWVLRKAMERHLPREIAWRKDKQGFVNPQGEWLKHELRGWIDDLLNGDLLIDQYGLVDRRRLQRRFETYCRQEADRGALSFRDVFAPLALEVWARRFEGALRA
jgi:asparagine synthase (glutamine-hydrolysing)